MVIVVVVLVLVSVLAFVIKLVALLEVLQWCSCLGVLHLQMVPITLTSNVLILIAEEEVKVVFFYNYSSVP